MKHFTSTTSVFCRHAVNKFVSTVGLMFSSFFATAIKTSLRSLTAACGLLLILLSNTTAFGQTNPTAFALSGGSFTFASQTATNTTYPTNMQGWNNGGTANVAVLPTAASTADFTMTASASGATSGLGNLGASGFNFLSTGSAPNTTVGAIAVALNSTGMSNLLVTWTAADQSATASLRLMNLTLQYRVGTTGVFTTVASSTYTTSASAQAAAQTFTNIALPSACDNQAVVQLRWIYYESAAQSGSRDPIRLDDITVSSSAIISSAQSGNWSATTTWVGGVVPTSASNALIASGHVVTMDSATYNTRNSGTSTTVSSGGTLATSVTYTNNGTTTVNGSFQLNAGGWVTSTSGTNDLVYGSAGTLIFNVTYTASNGNYWPTTNPPINVTVNSGCPLTLSFARSVSGIFATSASLTTAGNLTVSGTCQINTTAATFDAAINYGAASTLLYNVNTTMARGNEWNNSPANVTLQNNSVINYPSNWGTFTRTLTGNLTIGTGSALYMDYGSPGSGVGLLTVGGNVANSGSLSLGNQSGGDLAVGGNWTNSGTFAPNGRAVSFNGSGAQSITNASGETFAYLIVNKSAGTLTLANNITINAATNSPLQLLNAGGFDINGKTMTLSGAGGNIQVTGAARTISSGVAGGIIAITGGKTVTSTSSGSLILASNITTVLTAGLDFGSGLTTVLGTLQINTGGFASINAPIYGSASTLLYNSVTGYGVGTEWTGNATTAGAGVPQNVTLTSSSVNMPAAARGMAGILTIGAASTLALSSTIGADLSVAGNFTNSGTFTPNSRLVTFNGASAQTFTGAGTTTFDYLTLNNATGLTLGSTTSTIIVNQTLGLTSGKITMQSNNITIGATGSITGFGASNYLVTSGTGKVVRLSVGNTATLFPIGLNTTNYTPVTVTNTTGTSDLTVQVKSTITNTVADATKIVNLQWSVASSAATTATVTPVWVAANQAASFTNTGTGDLGNYTSSYTTYPVTLNTTTTTGTGVALQSGSNLIVVGNTSAIKCVNQTLTLTQGFNATTIPTCWTQQTVVGSSSLTYVASSSNPTTAPQEGSNYVYWNSFSITAGNETRLVSAPITTTGTSSVDVQFYWRNDNNTSYNTGAYLNEGVQVQYSTDGSTWTNAGSLFPRHDASLTAGTAAWKLKTLTLPAGAGNVSTLYVGFKFRSDNGDNCAMDAVTILATPSCVAPTGVTSSAVAATSATISWTASTSAPSAGYKYEIRTSGAAGSGATGLATSGTTAAGVVTTNLSGLTASTLYSVYVSSDCGSGSTSSWTTAVTFTTLCGTPTNVTSPAATVATASSAISWVSSTCYTEIMIVASSGAVNTGTPTGDGTAYTGSLVFGSGTALGNGFVAYKGATSPQTITGLTNGTLYYYKIFTRLGTAWSAGTEVFATPILTYCTPTYSTGPGTTDGILNVTLGTLNNTTGNSATPYYTFYNAVTVPNLTQSATSTISISYGTDANQWGAVWVDFNQNGTFETTEGFLAATNAGASGTSVISIVVPAGAILGNTRMRVRGGNDTTLTTAQACGASSSAYGETEDYIVNILAPTIPSITSLGSASGCVGTSITINGTNLTGATAATVTIGGTAVTSITSNSGTVLVAVIGTGTTGTVSVTTAGGTATSIDTFTVVPSPTASWAATATGVCFNASAQTTSLGYTATTNTPVSYSISWNASPTNSFVAVVDQANSFNTGSGTITLDIPAGTTAGTYTGTITVKNADGCVSTATQTFTIKVSGTPTTSNAGATQTICATGTATLAANSATVGTGAWTITSGPSLLTSQFSSLISNTAVFTPAGGTGAYVLTWTISNSPCTASASSVTINVNAAPTTSNAGINQSICPSGTVTLAANTPTVGTGAWSVSGPSTLTSQFSSLSSPTAVFTPAGGVGTYTLTWSISNSPCTASTSSITVTVNPTPSAITITPGSPNLCVGSSVGLTASGGTATTTNTFGTQANQNTATTYPAPFSVYYGGQRMQILVLASELSAKGLTNGSKINNIGFPVASLGANWGTTLTSCNNFKVKLGLTSLTNLTTFVTSGMATYYGPTNFTPVVGSGSANLLTFSSGPTWDGTSNLIIETTFSNNISGVSAGAVIQYYTATTGTNSMIQYRADTVTAAVAEAGTTISNGPNTNRPDFVLNVTAPASFAWTPAASGLNVYTGATVTATPTTTTTYTATSTVNGCPNSNSVTVNVNARPTAAITSGNVTICNGSSTTLSGTITANGAWTITLSGTGGTVTGTGSGNWSKSVSPSSTTTYTIATLTDSNCASIAGDLSGSAIVSVSTGVGYGNTQFPATASICPSDSFTVYGQVYKSGVTEAAGQGAGIVAELGYSTTNTDPSTWTNWQAAVFNTQSGNNDEYKSTLTGLSAGTTYYYAWRYAYAPCGYQYGGYSTGGGGFWNGTSNISGVLTVKQIPTVVANPVSGCAGTNIALNGTSSMTGGTGSYSPTSPYTNTTPGTYTYTYSYSVNGCTTTSSPGNITVYDYPTATANAVSGCAGTNITLNGTSNMTGGTESYSPASPYNNSTAGTYTYTYTYSKNGCSTTSAPGNITVNASTAITADPTDRTVCVGATPAPLSVSASGSGLTYEWFSNTTNSNTGGTSVATTATYTPPSTSAGTTYYYAIVTGTCGSATSNTSTVVVNDYSTNTTTITACDSYYWSVNGATYTGSGEYSATVGCVTETLFLTINSSTSESEAVTACDTYTWSVNGATYTTSGTYTSAGLNAAGCTHTKSLVLTINSSTSESEAVTACDTYTWSANGATYTTSGTYTSAGLNAGGCTHTKTLVLTINSSTSSVETVTSPTCGTYTWAVNSVTYTSSGTYTVTGTNAAGCVDTKTLVLTINPCQTVVNVKMMIQGYYVGSGLMTPAKYNELASTTSTDVDDITVELRDSSTYALVAVTSTLLQTDGNAQAIFAPVSNGSYYIAIKHRNTLETWSANPVTFGGSTVSYDFTTVATKAFGDNMFDLGSGVFGFYSGDINQDGNVDNLDYSEWELQSADLEPSTYYRSGDLNGDGNVDNLDYSVWEQTASDTSLYSRTPEHP